MARIEVAPNNSKKESQLKLKTLILRVGILNLLILVGIVSITVIAVTNLKPKVIVKKAVEVKIEEGVSDTKKKVKAFVDKAPYKERVATVEHNIAVVKAAMAEKYKEFGDNPKYKALKERLDRAIAKFERIKQNYKEDQ